MRNLKETILMAFSSILDNKVRYILTLVGIVLGISSLIAIVSLGNGVGDSIKDSIMSQGDSKSLNLIFKPTNNSQNDFLNHKFDPFNQTVINRISNIKGVTKVDRHYSGATEIKINDKDKMVNVNYCENNNTIKSNNIILGRNFNKYELNDFTRVCVINQSLEKQLYKSQNPIGKTLEVSNKPLTIIGVSKEETPELFMNTSNIYIPKPTWSIVYGDSSADGLKISIADNFDLDKMSKVITEDVNSKNVFQGEYGIFNMKNVAKSFGKVTSIITSFVASIAGISLLVGGTGVMNIMYVAIIERTREIGVRRALGATSKNILFQFLIESVVICFIGGLIGVILGLGVAEVVGKIIHIHAKASASIMMLGFGISIFMGIVFGISPALKAARLNPIDALSYE